MQIAGTVTTVWSFPQRGAWATHDPHFRGNFAPQAVRPQVLQPFGRKADKVPLNIIRRYSTEGETVLDPMMGGGTTLIEAKCHNRNAIGLDINPQFVQQMEEKLDFPCDTHPDIRTAVGDVRDLSGIADESIDLIVTHPPYLNIIRYSEGSIPGDLSRHGCQTGGLAAG